MNAIHPAPGVESLRRIAEGQGGRLAVVYGEQPGAFYSGTQRAAAATLLEAVLTFAQSAAYEEIVLVAGRGHHLPPLQVGPSVRLGATRAVVYLLRKPPEPEAEPPMAAPPSGPTRFLGRLDRRARQQEIAAGHRVELDASNMDWKTRQAHLFDRVEAWCGRDHLGARPAAAGDARKVRRLILLDAEYLLPDAALWSREISTEQSEAGHIPARFRRLPEVVRGTCNDLLLLARGQAEAGAIGAGQLIYRALDEGAQRFSQFRLEWPAVERMSIPGATLGSAMPEFYPEIGPTPYQHFRGVALQKPKIDRILPLESFTPEELFRRLTKEVIGQDPSMRKIAGIICHSVASRLADDTRPIASILLAGPTGSGKTETARALAKALFGRIDARFHDCKMEQCKMSAFNLFGLEPGFVGYTPEMRLNGGGMITSPIIRNPGRVMVMLLDELEKGHEEAPEALFGALDQGYAKDSSSGHQVSFRNVIFVVTTNEAGTEIGEFADRGASWEALAGRTPQLIHQCGRKQWALPFLARFHAVLPFAHPKADDLPLIAAKLTRECIEGWHNFAGANPEFYRWASSSFRRELGVRDMRRTIEARLASGLAALPKDRGRLWLRVDAGGALSVEG